MVDDSISNPKSRRYASLNALHFGYPVLNKTWCDAALFLRRNMRADIEKKAKTSACLNDGNNLNFRIPSTKVFKKTVRNTRQGNPTDFMGNLHFKNYKLPPLN